MAAVSESNQNSNISYFIDEEKGRVEAVIRCGLCADARFIADKLTKYANANNGQCPIRQSTFYNPKRPMLTQYSGIAKCHPDDVFNVEFGKRLALARAQFKYHFALRKSLFDFIREIERVKSYLIDSDVRIKDIIFNYMGQDGWY